MYDRSSRTITGFSNCRAYSTASREAFSTMSVRAFR